MTTTLQAKLKTFPAILGTFKNGTATPNERFNIRKSAKVMIVFLEAPDGKTKREENILRMVKEGYREYQDNKTEDYDQWMLREYPQIYKTNRSKTRKNVRQN